jgi:hypothetical protein
LKIERGTFLALCGAIACKVEQPAPVVPIVSIAPTTTSSDVSPIVPTETAAPCDDSVAKGMGPTCEGMNDPESSCAPFEFPRAQCDEFVDLLKPRLAEEYAACMRALTPGDLCDAMKTYACKEKALRDACPGGDVGAYCAAEGQPTAETDQGCMLWARGLDEAGRAAAMQTCGFTWSCMEALRSPSSE